MENSTITLFIVVVRLLISTEIKKKENRGQVIKDIALSSPTLSLMVQLET